MKTCTVQDCDRSAETKDGGRKQLCMVHYARLRTKGHVNEEKPIRVSPGTLLRFLEEHLNYEKDECLTWPYSKYNNGYGHILYQGKRMPASRLMCLLAHGEPKEGKVLAAHNCGKGHEGCVNPKHLYWASYEENCEDQIKHGTKQWGEKSASSKLTEKQVIEIRQLSGTMSQSKIANIYGVSQGTVWRIIHRVCWNHI